MVEEKENQKNWEKMKNIQQREEELARKLHEWYLEACQKPESGMDFNPAAQKPYENLKETQKFLDRYIAKKVIAYIQQAREEEKERQFNMLIKCLPKDAENLSTLTPDQAKRLIECFIQNRPWD